MLRQFCLLARLATGAPAYIHGSVELLVDFVSFLIISFVCSAGKEAVLDVGALKLFRIDIRLFTSPGLRLAVNAGLRVMDGPSEGPRTITSAEGPSLVEPISKRVVKPDALGMYVRKMYGRMGEQGWALTLVQNQRHMRLVLAWTRNLFLFDAMAAKLDGKVLGCSWQS